MLLRLFLLRLLRRWHARIGFSAMLFFLILAVTGLILNHGEGLGLDGRYVHAGWLARWYGIQSNLPAKHSAQAITSWSPRTAAGCSMERFRASGCRNPLV